MVNYLAPVLCATLLVGGAQSAETNPARAELLNKIVAADLYRLHPTETMRMAEVARAVREEAAAAAKFAQPVDPRDPGITRKAEAFGGGRVVHVIPERSYGGVVREVIERQNANPNLLVAGLQSGFGLAGLAAAGVAAPGAAAWGAASGVAEKLTPTLADRWLKSTPYATSAERAIDDVAWALAQERSKSPAGQALRQPLAALGYNGKVALKDQLAVREHQKTFGAPQRSEAHLIGQIDLDRKLETLGRRLDELGKSIETPPSVVVSVEQTIRLETRRHRSEVADQTREVQGSLMAAGYALQLAGDAKGGAIVLGISDVAGRAAGLIENIDRMGPALLTGNFLGLAAQVTGLLGKAKDPVSPYPTIFRMLEALQRQVQRLGEDLNNNIARMDTRLGNMIESVARLQHGVAYDTARLREEVIYIQNQLATLTRDRMSGEIAIARLINAETERSCLISNGERRPKPPADFLKCRDAYVDHATSFARGPLAKSPAAPIDLSAFNQLFPLADGYNELAVALRYPAVNPALGLANPNAWFTATSSLLTLLDRFPEYLKDIDMVNGAPGPQSLTLDPVIGAGEELLAFQDAVSFVKNGRIDPAIQAQLETLVDRLAKRQAIVYDEVAVQLRHTGLLADVTADARQTPAPGYEYQFTKGANVQFCDATVKPNIVDTESIWISGSGGADPYRDPKWTDAIRPSVQATSIARLQPDPSLVAAIARPALLSEQLRPDEYKVEPCVRSVTLEKLNMDAQPRVGVSATFDIFLVEKLQKRRTKVQTIAVRPVTMDFGRPGEFNTILIHKKEGNKYRGAEILHVTWPRLGGLWANHLVDQSDAESRENLGTQEAVVNQILAGRRGELLRAFNVDRHEREIEEIRRNILLMVGIGTNTRSAAADRFLRELVTESNLRVGASVASILDGSATVQDQRADLARRSERLRARARDLFADPVEIARVSPIADRLATLRQVYALRAKQLK